jgi:hypothetical protein
MPVTRKALKMVVAVLFAVLALASISEAAPAKGGRHHPRHSSRLSTGGHATTGKAKLLHAKSGKARGPSSATSSHAKRKTTKPR